MDRILYIVRAIFISTNHKFGQTLCGKQDFQNIPFVCIKHTLSVYGIHTEPITYVRDLSAQFARATQASKWQPQASYRFGYYQNHHSWATDTKALYVLLAPVPQAGVMITAATFRTVRPRSSCQLVHTFRPRLWRPS